MRLSFSGAALALLLPVSSIFSCSKAAEKEPAPSESGEQHGACQQLSFTPRGLPTLCKTARSVVETTLREDRTGRPIDLELAADCSTGACEAFSGTLTNIQRETLGQIDSWNFDLSCLGSGEVYAGTVSDVGWGFDGDWHFIQVFVNGECCSCDERGCSSYGDAPCEGVCGNRRCLGDQICVDDACCLPGPEGTCCPAGAYCNGACCPAGQFCAEVDSVSQCLMECESGADCPEETPCCVLVPDREEPPQGLCVPTASNCMCKEDADCAAFAQSDPLICQAHDTEQGVSVCQP